MIVKSEGLRYDVTTAAIHGARTTSRKKKVLDKLKIDFVEGLEQYYEMRNAGESRSSAGKLESRSSDG